MRVRLHQGDTFQIIDVLEDGNVKMKRYNADGTLEKKIVSSKFEVFRNKYKLTKKVRTVLATYAAKDIGSSESNIDLALSCRVQFAVCTRTNKLAPRTSR